MTKKSEPVASGKVWVGVECGYHQEQPVINIYRGVNEKDIEIVTKKWLKSPFVKLPSMDNHRRKRYHAIVDQSLLKEDNSAIAKAIIDKNVVK